MEGQVTNALTEKTVDREVLEKFAAEYNFKINPELTEEQRLHLLDLLYEFRDVFAKELKDITGYPHYQMKLDVVDPRSCYQRQYKLTSDDAAEMQRQIDDMADSGIIEPSECVDWNVPLFLVDKKDGKKRVIANLRRRNMAIVPKIVALSNITDLFTEIQNQRPAFYSCYDLFSGYYQVFFAENSRNMTSFTAPSGLRYRFVRAPMGLAVSPAAMLTVLTHVLGRLRQSRQAWSYMDDVISAGRDFPELLGSMREVLQALRDNNLKCNPKNVILE